ncbi:alpha/beta fold hydrolase [uncultured Streptomyces sp.]|uniref:alpha/beta fold hydrolase n=1 Tax=uncultured Streptomyces sp. TaxID=174707 RepID=UPI002602A020|nr:alpha/beta hydrolase [uncultured Streptomyces sp.]
MDTILSLDGTSIAYRRQGEGPPAVLVGGALSTSATEEPLARLLAPHFTVLTYDRRGRGASGDGVGRYSVRRETEDLAAVLHAAGGPASVFGMSSGGALALEARAAGVRMDRLSVFEPPYTPGEQGLRYKARCTAGLHARLGAGDRGGAVELFLTRTGVPPETVARMRRAPLWRGLESLAHTLAYDDALLGDGAVPAARFGGTTGRTLVVCGGLSPAVTRSATLALAAAIPRARHRTLTGQTRELAPHVIAPVLTEFFAREAWAGRAA